MLRARAKNQLLGKGHRGHRESPLHVLGRPGAQVQAGPVGREGRREDRRIRLEAAFLGISTRRTPPALAPLPVQVAAVEVVHDHDREVLDDEAPDRLGPEILVVDDLRPPLRSPPAARRYLRRPRSTRSRASSSPRERPRSANLFRPCPSGRVLRASASAGPSSMP